MINLLKKLMLRGFLFIPLILVMVQEISKKYLHTFIVNSLTSKRLIMNFTGSKTGQSNVPEGFSLIITSRILTKKAIDKQRLTAFKKNGKKRGLVESSNRISQLGEC